MKKLLLVLIPILLAAVIVAVLKFDPHAVNKRDLAGTTLNLYTWDTYIAPELFKEFEQETGIKVVSAIFDNNDDMLKKLQSGASYDLITPSGNYLWHLVEKNLVLPLPEYLRALGESLAEPVQNPPYDPKYKYALPLFYGTAGIAVNTEKTKEEVTSWKQLFERPAGEAQETGMLDEISSVITAASLTLGTRDCDASDGTLAMVKDLLQKQEPFVKTYSSENYYDRIASGEVKIQMAWSGDAYIARKKNAAVKYVYPKEGVDLWLDVLAIPSTATNKEAASRFIEFILQPKRMAAYAAVSGNIPSVADAMQHTAPEMRDAPEFNIPKGTRALITQACPPEKADAYAKIVEPFLTR